MKSLVFRIAGVAACALAGAETVPDSVASSEKDAEPAAMAETDAAGIVRKHLQFMNPTFSEKDIGVGTVFTYHLSVDDEHAEEYRCQVIVLDGEEYVSSRAILPLTIPESRMEAVAEKLASWSGKYAIGQFFLDFDAHAAYYESRLPVDVLRDADPPVVLAFFGLTMYNMAEKDEEIRAAVAGRDFVPPVRPPVEPPPAASGSNGGEKEPVDSGKTGEIAFGCPDLAGGEEDGQEEQTDDDHEEEQERYHGQVDIPTGDRILAWIRSRGEDPMILADEGGETTYQFSAGLADGEGPFTSATVLITAAGHWTCVYVIPEVRFKPEQQRNLSKTILRLSAEEKFIMFQRIGIERVAARASLPSFAVDANPDRVIPEMLNAAGKAINRRGEEILRAFQAPEP